MKIKTILITVVALAFPGTGVSAGESGINLHDAWIAEGPPAVKRHAGYVEIENSGPADVALNEVTSPDFERIEIHHSVTVDGINKMLYQRYVTITAGGHMTFAPGGYHLMLFNARKAMPEGETVTLTFGFDNGDKIRIDAKVKKLQGTGHSHQ